MIPAEKDKMVPPEVCDFILTLIQAFLKTGYYRSNHPEAKKAMEGLYQGLQKILEDKAEISFLSVADGPVPEVFIVGLTTDPLPVSSLMMKSMSEVFVTRFNDFFERKRLSAFTMKADISSYEFEKFIGIMTESPFDREKEVDVREKLTVDLIKNQILSVSTIFNVDLVGKDKKLPWRVNIALSRLKKDLNMIPLFKGISHEKANEIRRLIFEDIIRPLNTASLATDILINLDLIRNDIAGFNPDDFENSIIENLNRRLLPNVARLLIDEINVLKESYGKLQVPELMNQIANLSGTARKISFKLFEDNSADEELVSRFVKCGLLNEDELPAELAKKIYKHVALDRFLQSPEDFFEQVKKATDPADIEDRILILFDCLPALFSMGKYPEILEIMKISVVKKMPFDTDMHSALLAKISSAILSRTETASKEEQSELLNVLSFLGRSGNYLIVGLLDSPSRYLRRQTLELLGRKGPEIIPIILAEAKQKEGWFFLRNALIVLTKINAGGPETENLFRHSLRHEEPNVRKEAVQGIPIVLRGEGESLLLPLLTDPDTEVRKRAATSLVGLKSAHPKLLDYLIGLLTDKSGDGNSDQGQIIELMTDLDLPHNERSRLEDIIIELLKGPSILARVTKQVKPGPAFKRSAIELLGKSGTTKSARVLKGYVSDKDPALGKAASEAIEKIRKRTD
jgi:HEAT repeat protein